MRAVNRGELPFLEDGLATVLAEQVGAGRLRAQTVTPSARTYVIAVPTPLTREGNTADLSLVEAATRQIAPCLTGDELIVLESTCPPGTTRALAEALISMRPDLSLDGSGGRRRVHVAHCPERVLPGRIMTEMVTNSRVIGGLTPEASHLARDLYATFCRGELVLTDATTAEMTKLTENSFRDLNIAFANELAHGSWSPPRPRRPGSSARLARSTTPGPPTTSGASFRRWKDWSRRLWRCSA